MLPSKKVRLSAGLAAIIYVLPAAAHASETVTHQYDELGRLISSTKTGGPATGSQTTTAYDPAGNRSNQTTSGATGGGTPPPPPPVNQPPVANGDLGGTMAKCSFKTVNVTGNDTDPEGSYPLEVVSVFSNQIGITIANTTSIQFESGSSTGGKSATYTVKDSLGATSTGTVSITVSGGTCV